MIKFTSVSVTLFACHRFFLFIKRTESKKKIRKNKKKRNIQKVLKLGDFDFGKF